MSEPVEKSITVKCSLEHAFRVFTDQIHVWWPVSHRMSGDSRSSMILEPREGGALYSVDPQGGRKDFGSVRSWEPPDRVVFTWALGTNATLETEVEIRFQYEDGQDGVTRVDLVHREARSEGDSWERTSPGFARAWTIVLPAYQAFIQNEGARS